MKPAVRGPHFKRVLEQFIAAGSIFFCAIPALAQSILFHNFTGHSWIDGDLRRIDAMLVVDGRVVASGGLDSIDLPDGARKIDLDGAIVIPGLIDAHGHVLNLGSLRAELDLTGTRSKQEALERVRAYAEANPNLFWITGRGWNQELWSVKEFPSARDLDDVTKDRAAFLRRVDGHAGWANTLAMQQANIDRSVHSPAGGKIIRDKTGKPTGIFVDMAMDLIRATIPAPRPEDLDRALRMALLELNSLGVTGVHDAGISIADVNRYRAFADQDALTVRIYGMLSGADENLDAMDEALIGYGDDRLTVRSVKLYADGALGSRGAALIDDYSDDTGNRGLLFFDQGRMNAMVDKVVSKGFQVNIHAIGDRGNRVALNAIEAAQKKTKGMYRNRIEHAQVVSLDDIPRFATLEVIASMQPTHATSDMNMAESRVGPERIKGAYAWRAFLDQGTVVTAGSDFPVEYPNPMFGIFSAVARTDHNGEPIGGWYPEQAMTVAEALKAFTIDAAYAAFQEKDVGSLAPGFWADFIVLDRDIFEIDASELWQVEVEQTWLAGELIFARGAIQ